jgi:hypothetical protein
MKLQLSLTRTPFLLVAFILFNLPLNSVHADDQSEGLKECGVQVSGYLDLASAYELSTKRSPKEFRELAGAYKDAIRERNQCLRLINTKFKDDLRAIKSKYEALKGDRTSSRALRETQRLAEISNATLYRDEAIRNLPPLPALPERPVKR